MSIKKKGLFYVSNKPKTISTSDIRFFKSCRQRWDFSSVLRQGLQPRRTPNFFIRGRVWHKALEKFYSSRGQINIVSAFEKALVTELKHEREKGTVFEPEVVEAWLHEGRTVLRMFPFWAQQQNFSFDNFEILMQEVRDTQPLLITDKQQIIAEFSFKADMVIRDPAGKVWLVDFKTVNQMPHDTSFLDFDEQITGYLTALEQRLNEHVTGAIFIYL